MNCFQDWVRGGSPSGIELHGGFFKTNESIRWVYKPCDDLIHFQFQDKNFTFDIEAAVCIKPFKKTIVIKSFYSLTTSKCDQVTTYGTDFNSFLVIARYVTMEFLFDHFAFACFGDDWNVTIDNKFAFA